MLNLIYALSFSNMIRSECLKSSVQYKKKQIKQQTTLWNVMEIFQKIWLIVCNLSRNVHDLTLTFRMSHCTNQMCTNHFEFNNNRNMFPIIHPFFKIFAFIRTSSISSSRKSSTFYTSLWFRSGYDSVSVYKAAWQVGVSKKVMLVTIMSHFQPIREQFLLRFLLGVIPRFTNANFGGHDKLYWAVTKG